MIALDMDGVIANPYEEINRRVKAAGTTPKNWEEWTEFQTWKIYPDLPKKTMQWWYRTPTVLLNAVPFPDTWYWMQHLASKGEKFVIVTHRAKNLVEGATWRWALDWELPIEDIHFVQGDKAKVLVDLEECSVFVEDKAENAALAAAAGVNSYLINRGYNKYDDEGDAKRIDSVWEIEYAS